MPIVRNIEAEQVHGIIFYAITKYMWEAHTCVSFKYFLY